MTEYLQLLKDCSLLDSSFSQQAAIQLFVFVQDDDDINEELVQP